MMPYYDAGRLKQINDALIVANAWVIGKTELLCRVGKVAKLAKFAMCKGKAIVFTCGLGFA